MSNFEPIYNAVSCQLKGFKTTSDETVSHLYPLIGLAH
jgi:hypothetical protein